MKWEQIGAIKASAVKMRILELLLKQPLTPKDVSSQLAKHLSQISTNLSQLTEMGLVECKTPTLRKGKLYSITVEGKEVLEAIGGQVVV